MRILHLLASNKFSGAENVVCQIIDMFRNDQNYEMLYCSVDGPIRNVLDERKIVFCPIKKMSLGEVRRIITSQKPDLIHAHDMRASYVATKVSAGIPVISHIHNNSYASRGLSLKAFAYFFAAKKAKHIFWVSKSAYKNYFFHKNFCGKSTVLYNIVDVRGLYEKAACDRNEYSFDLIFLGRLTKVKNPFKLLNICKIMVEKKPDLKVAIVGDGDMEAAVKKKAEEMRLLKNVHFFGFQRNPLKILQGSKVMIMTSLWEGTPMCALEAIAFGLPIVATPVDGLKDLIVNDFNGFLSESDEILANKAIKYITNDGLRAEIYERQKVITRDWNDRKKYYEALKKEYSDIDANV